MFSSSKSVTDGYWSRTDGKPICLDCALFNGRGCINNHNASSSIYPNSCPFYTTILSSFKTTGQ